MHEELLQAYDDQLRGAAEVQGEAEVDRLGPLWLAQFRGDRGFITYRTLPADARSVWYQDNEYFECDNVFFRKTPDGYKVVAAPWKS